MGTASGESGYQCGGGFAFFFGVHCAEVQDQVVVFDAGYYWR